MSLLHADYGDNDLLFTRDGQAYIDLISSTGAVFLGHANRSINQHIVDQLDRISCSWTSALSIQEACRERVGSHLGAHLRLHSLYSSGMEAAEVAMRIAFHETKRGEVVGFLGNNHGKSIATQNLTGQDRDIPRFTSFRQLPFIPDHAEDDALESLEKAVVSGNVAAVFVESLQGKGGGHAASTAFYRELQRLCRREGVLIVCDEIFTGFYRTGPCFHHSTLEIEPDIVLVGKAIANGFPAAGVIVDRRMTYHPKDFRLSSTYSDNPLACAAVVGTLTEMERIGVQDRVADIERSLRALAIDPGCTLRLRGAACFIDFDDSDRADRVHSYLHQRGVLSLRRGNFIGFWPPATITAEHLHHVVQVTNEALAVIG